MTKIKTYDTVSFRGRYMQPGQKLDEILKTDFGKFFIVKVEDMIRLIKLPVPPSRATAHSFIYLTAGEAVMNIGSETYTIYADECLIVPAGQVYSFDNIDINQGYLCHFQNDMISGKFGNNELLKSFEFLNVWGNPEIHLDQQTSEYVAHLFKRILADYSDNGIGNPDIIQSYFIALLCEVNKAYKPVSASKQTNSVHITNQFKELIFKNIQRKHLVTDYASILNISPNHLNKSVKLITGKSPIRWINEAIILESKVLLYQSKLSIGEVAAEVGILDASYFSRLFKKIEGISPQSFRRMIEMS